VVSAATGNRERAEPAAAGGHGPGQPGTSERDRGEGGGDEQGKSIAARTGVVGGRFVDRACRRTSGRRRGVREAGGRVERPDCAGDGDDRSYAGADAAERRGNLAYGRSFVHCGERSAGWRAIVCGADFAE